MKKVLIIAAPFGYGPASKALYLAQLLTGKVDLTLLTSGEAFEFMQAAAPAGSDCIKGVLSREFTPASLSKFDFIISVNNGHVVPLLTQIGLGSRVIFLDSLLAWRKGQDEVRGHGPILRYLVQDFPGLDIAEATCQARQTQLIAPVVWSPSRQVAAEQCDGVLVSMGGITSPLIKWPQVSHIFEAQVQSIAQAANRNGRKLTVIGSDYLRQIDIEGNVQLLGTVNPLQVQELMAASELLFTTPGIGTTFEANSQLIPAILLPPTNSTQLQHYQVFSEAGLPNLLQGEDELDGLYSIRNSDWQQQASLVMQWQEQHLGLVRQCLESRIDAFFRQGSGLPAAMREAQEVFFKSLSGVQVEDVLDELLQV